MCGRYVLYESVDLQSRYGINDKAILADDNFNVSPGQFMPIVIMADGQCKLVDMKWGLVPVWAKDIKIGYRLINARDDGLFIKSMWRNLIKSTRALVPARGFYEWAFDDQHKKRPYFIHPKDKQIFSFAGLYSIWKDMEGRPLYTFTIITTGPNKEMEPIHNRMPVIINKFDEYKWLDPEMTDEKAINKFLHPSPDGSLDIYPVSTNVNSPRNNDPTLLEKRITYNV